MEPNAQLHAALVALKTGVITGYPVVNRRVGICDNTHGFAYYHLYAYFCAWPDFSGYFTFPVSDPTGRYRADEAYFAHADMWAGDYGAARLRLLDFLIEATR